MSDWRLPWEGGCRCGQLRIRVTAPPLISTACHCTGCQRMSSSAFSLTLILPAAGFEVTSGEPVVGGASRPSPHRFCGHCMTWVFTRIDEMRLVNLRPTMLDDPSWFVPYLETYTAEKLPWATTPAVHSFEKFPREELYQPLIEEFAQKGARPRG